MVDGLFAEDLAFVAELAVEDSNAEVSDVARAYIDSLDLPIGRTKDRTRSIQDPVMPDDSFWDVSGFQGDRHQQRNLAAARVLGQDAHLRDGRRARLHRFASATDVRFVGPYVEGLQNAKEKTSPPPLPTPPPSDSTSAHDVSMSSTSRRRSAVTSLSSYRSHVRRAFMKEQGKSVAHVFEVAATLMHGLDDDAPEMLIPGIKIVVDEVVGALDTAFPSHPSATPPALREFVSAQIGDLSLTVSEGHLVLSYVEMRANSAERVARVRVSPGPYDQRKKRAYRLESRAGRRAHDDNSTNVLMARLAAGADDLSPHTGRLLRRLTGASPPSSEPLWPSATEIRPQTRQGRGAGEEYRVRPVTRPKSRKAERYLARGRTPETNNNMNYNAARRKRAHQALARKLRTRGKARAEGGLS